MTLSARFPSFAEVGGHYQHDEHECLLVCMCHCIPVKVRGQPVGVSSHLLPWDFRTQVTKCLAGTFNSGCVFHRQDLTL